ncbi:MAG: MATE family efflux transporter [Christensenellales bacterium]
MNSPILSRILRIGLPAAIQTSVISFSNVFVQAYINEFQSSCMAGWTSYNRLDAFAWLPMLCLGMANTTFVGQNLGAGKLDRVKKGVNIGILIAMAGTLIIVVPLMCFSDTMLKLFDQRSGGAALRADVRAVHVALLYSLLRHADLLRRAARRGRQPVPHDRHHRVLCSVPPAVSAHRHAVHLLAPVRGAELSRRLDRQHRGTVYHLPQRPLGAKLPAHVRMQAA